MKNNVKHVGFGAIIFTILTVLFYKADSSNRYLKTDIDHTINHLTNHDTLFNEKLVKIKYGIIQNYNYLDDDSNSITENFLKLNHALNKNIDTLFYETQISKPIKSYKSLLEKREFLLGKFKSEHAILSDSVSAFPKMISLMLQYLAYDDEDFNAAFVLKDLLHNIILYRFTFESKLEFKITESMDKLRLIRDQFLPQVANDIDHILLHAQIILNKKPLESNLFMELLWLPTAQPLDHIRRSHDEFYNHLKQESDIYRIFLYIFSLLLLAYVVYVLYRLKMNARALYASKSQLEYEVEKRKRFEAKLYDANEQLESRVAGRTRDLEHSNAQLQSEILERQATEVALRASETRYRALIEGSRQGISIISMAGERLFANIRLAEILGYDNLDAYMRHNPGTNIAPHEQTRLRDYRDAMRRGEASPNFYEYEGRRTDGTPIWLERLVTPIIWDGETALFSSIVDITERKHAEAERARLQRELLESSRQAGMAEVATGVLHNVGNVLNSVTTAAALACEQLHQSHVRDLAKVVDLIDAHSEDLGTFITTDPKGRHLPTFLHRLAQHLLGEHKALIEHLQTVNDKIEHIREIVAMQQSYATAAGNIEPLALSKLMDDALMTNDQSFYKHEVEVVRAYAELPLILTDRHKVLQILVNLIGNAKHALVTSDSTRKRLTVRVSAGDAEHVYLEVEDNGVGIAAAELTRIFQHGFTTKVEGHGFGLHSSALAAQELEGCLTVHSDGPGRGAVFRLELPKKEAVANTV